MSTTLPPARRMRGRAACVTANNPVTLMSIWLRNSSMGRNSSGPPTAMPALLTTPSSLPPVAAPTSSRAAPMPTSSVTSRCTGVSRPERAASASLSPSASLRTPRIRSPSFRDNGVGFEPEPTKPVTPGVLRTAYQVSSSM